MYFPTSSILIEFLILAIINREWLTYKETLDGIVEGRLRHDKD